MPGQQIVICAIQKPEMALMEERTRIVSSYKETAWYGNSLCL